MLQILMEVRHTLDSRSHLSSARKVQFNADSHGRLTALSPGSDVERLALEQRSNHGRMHNYLTDAQLLQDAFDVAAWTSSSSSGSFGSSKVQLRL